MKLKYVNNNDQHAYYLDGKRAKGVTSVASYPDNRYNLELWGKRMEALGFIARPDLLEAIAAHHDDKHQVDKYIDDAIEAAKASAGANRGVAAHRITERFDLGEEILTTDLSVYVVNSWQAALDAADLEVIPEYVERIVVDPDHRICGRFDRILRNRTTGVLYIADVKGGERALRFPHPIACQCAMYANFPLIAAPIPDSGGETTDFQPMPDVDKDWGYIFHLPESGEAAVAKVNIADGWRTVQHIILPTITWRDRTDLCQPVATIGGNDLEWAPVPSDASPKIDKLRARYQKLTHEKKAWIDGYVGTLDPDRYELGLALIRFAELDADDNLLRAAVKHVLGTLSIRTPLRDNFADMDEVDASNLAQIALNIHDGQYAIIINGHGTVTLKPTKERAKA
jgi:hypothetical protein